MRTICGTILAASVFSFAVLAEDRQSVCQLENADKAYEELYGYVAERVCLWPGLAPGSIPSRAAQGQGVASARRFAAGTG